MKSTVYMFSLYSAVSLEGTIPWMVCINSELIGNILRINYLKHSESEKKPNKNPPCWDDGQSPFISSKKKENEVKNVA